MQGASRGAVCSAKLVLEAGESLPRLRPAASPGDTGQGPVRLAEHRGSWMPKVESSTRSNLVQLKDHATRHLVPREQQYLQGLYLEPGDPKWASLEEELITGTVVSLQIRKNNQQPSKTELRLEWNQQLIPSAQCWGGHVWILCLFLSPEFIRRDRGEWVWWLCRGLRGVGQVWQAGTKQRGSNHSCRYCCLKESYRGGWAELPRCSGYWEGSGAGWAAAPPRCCQDCRRVLRCCHSSAGVLPAAAQGLAGPGWGQFASATTGQGRNRLPCWSEQQFIAAAPCLCEEGVSRAVSGL